MTSSILSSGSRSLGPASNRPDDGDEDGFADDELLKALEAEYGIEGDFTVRTFPFVSGCIAH